MFQGVQKTPTEWIILENLQQPVLQIVLLFTALPSPLNEFPRSCFDIC